MNTDEKRAKIREEIAVQLFTDCSRCIDKTAERCNIDPCGEDWEIADRILQALNGLVVIPVPTPGPRLWPQHDFLTLAEQCACEQGMRDLIKVGYSKHEPLVKE